MLLFYPSMFSLLSIYATYGRTILDLLVRPVGVLAEVGRFFFVDFLLSLTDVLVVHLFVRLHLEHLNAFESCHRRMSHDIWPFFLLNHLVLLVKHDPIKEEVDNLIDG